MLVFKARRRRDPVVSPTLTNSERRVMRTLRDAMLEVRADTVVQEGKILDAIVHSSSDTVANLITVEPWLAAQPIIEAELLGELIAAGQRVKLPTMEKATISYRFDATRPEAARWAATQAGGLIVEIITQQRQVVKDLAARSAMGVLSPQQVARNMRDSIGLTREQSLWVQNFRQNQITERMAAGASFDQAWTASEAATERYHARIHRYRSETIARTEILRASSEGRREGWQQGVEEGFIDTNWIKVWSTEFDDRTCPECEDMEGETAPVLGDFPEGDPPLHPNCRCTLLLEEPPRAQDFSSLSDDELEALIFDLMDEE